mgnify:CR=1 FL=1
MNKLLIVEDDPNLGQILREYLQAKGFEARLQPDGEEGLKAFYADKFDMCILDLMMPKKDGQHNVVIYVANFNSP